MKKGQFSMSVSKSGRVRVCLDLLRKARVKNKIIVDIGSSFGWLEKEISGWGASQVIGIEPEEEALAFARRNLKGVKFVHGWADKIPLADSYADVILLFDVIEHVSLNSEQQTLGEIARVLKRDGVLLLSTPNSNIFSNIFDPAWYFGHRHYKKQFIEKILKKSGFLIKEIYIRGNLWSFIYYFWFYFVKHILGVTLPKNKFLEKKDDESFSKNGFHTIFLVAEKNYPLSS